jgi:hypothetical protein
MTPHDHDHHHDHDHDAARHRRLRALVDEAAELPEEHWTAFLEAECPEDAALRGEARRLLEHARAASAERFLQPPAPTPAEVAATVTDSARGLGLGPPAPARVGKYQVVRRFA